MAVSFAIDNSLNSSSVDKNTERFLGTLTFSGNYTQPGDTLSFASIYGIQSQLPPTRVEIFEQPPAGTAASGVSFVFALGSTQANGAVQLFQGSTQVSSATSYASLSLTTVKCWVYFPLFN